MSGVPESQSCTEISDSFCLETANLTQTLFKHTVLTLPEELKQYSHLLPAELFPSLDEAIQFWRSCACSRGYDEMSVSYVKTTCLAWIKADVKLGLGQIFCVSKGRVRARAPAFLLLRGAGCILIACLMSSLCSAAFSVVRVSLQMFFWRAARLGFGAAAAAELPQPTPNPPPAGSPERHVAVRG